MIRRTASYTITFLLASGSILTGIILAKNPDTAIERLLSSPDLLSLVAQQGNGTAEESATKTRPLLIHQARAFALYLDPPPAPEPKMPPGAAAAVKTKDSQPAPSPRPAHVAARFQVLAISVYRARPERSMALIVEAGAEPRWVKCGQSVGHLSIDRIEKRQVVWRHGEKTGQMAVVVDPPAKPSQRTHTPATPAATRGKVPTLPLAKKQDSRRPPAPPGPAVKRRGLQPRR